MWRCGLDVGEPLLSVLQVGVVYAGQQLNVAVPTQKSFVYPGIVVV